MSKPTNSFGGNNGNHSHGMGGMGGGGFNIPQGPPAYYDKLSGFGGNVYDKNPYHGASGLGQHGPSFFTPS